ncbi:MAG: PAS domain-containing protein [candidate division Zixibacteria bacterium]|nr:PAS domain-containing protein [candidate division Zixibacteria bacterium]
MARRWKILSGLRFRYVLVSFILLIVILIAAGYFSIQAGQEVSLDSLTQQGKALTTVLIASASNIIETDRNITDIAVEEIVAKTSLYINDNSIDDDHDLLEALVAQMGLVRANIVDSHNSMITCLETEPRSISAILDSLQGNFLSNARYDEPFDIVFDFHSVGEKSYLFGLVPYKDDKFIMLISPWAAGQYGDRKLSLAYLLNQLSQEAGIEYIMLQNLDGIVFASKQISQTDRIEDDPFLVQVLEADTAASRVIDFQDREVLEVVQTFNSGEEFYGLFRVGMSLFGYRQLTAGFKKQVWLFVVLLVLLGFVGIAIVIGYQNLNVTQDSLSRVLAISQSLHDSIAGIVLTTDENLRLVSVNKEARKHFGLPDGSPNDWSYEVYFPNDPFQVKAVLDEHRPKNFEIQIKGSSGPMHLLVSTSTLFGEGDKPTGVIVVAHDISEKRALESQAQQASRLSELGTVAAGLAHDIRNPLNAIGLVVQRLGNEIKVADNREEFDEFLATLKMEHTKLNGIIEKILQVARSSRLQIKDTWIKQVVQEAISLYRYEASENDIELTAEITDGLVRINEATIKSVVSNLIKNAIEAIGEKGKIEVISRFENENLVIIVSDSGSGIDQEQMKNLFKPFYTTKPGGTGLGLATAHKAAVDHGGDLKVQSKPGGPTVFKLTIPVKREL